MNLRAGRPVSEARAEAPPTRGWRRLCTHMRSQYDAEVLAAIGCPREPDHPNRPLPLGRSPSAAVNFRNEIRDRIGFVNSNYLQNQLILATDEFLNPTSYTGKLVSGARRARKLARGLRGVGLATFGVKGAITQVAGVLAP